MKGLAARNRKVPVRKVPKQDVPRTECPLCHQNFMSAKRKSEHLRLHRQKDM